jgi:hypothetical protein
MREQLQLNTHVNSRSTPPGRLRRLPKEKSSLSESEAAAFDDGYGAVKEGRFRNENLVSAQELRILL